MAGRSSRYRRAVVEPAILPGHVEARVRLAGVWLSVAALGIAALLVRLPGVAPALVWNASPSSPRGLYLVLADARPVVGSQVIAWPPASAAALADARGYLPQGIPLVKTVAASAGERVCALGDRLEVGARLLVRRHRADGLGRLLPQWSGCRILGADELMLLGLGDPASFDSRYFGPVRSSQILGRAIPLWRP